MLYLYKCINSKVPHHFIDLHKICLNYKIYFKVINFNFQALFWFCYNYGFQIYENILYDFYLTPNTKLNSSKLQNL